MVYRYDRQLSNRVLKLYLRTFGDTDYVSVLFDSDSCSILWEGFMVTVIVGENASGKTCYLNMLYNKYDCVYNRRAEEAIIRPIDISLKSAVFPDSDDLQDATNPLEVGRIIDIMLRKSDILLLDEVDSTVDESDKHLVYKVAMLVSKAKPVYAVTHDEDITIYADKVCKLNGML